MNVAEEFFNAQKALFEHVGFVPDWVEYAIDDQREMLWETNMTPNGGGHVKFAETQEKMDSDGEYYQDEIYTQRFYEKWVYEGEDVTMIFCHPGVDGINWFKVFDNSKRIK
jgi:hypothetical protein